MDSEEVKGSGKRKANKLVNETSTYLLQHAYNPVDWYPWGPEAISRARNEDRPILLSVGYSACHWCHVMEHESFEDESTAELMNMYFVNIKVDREERPDIDEIYMKSVQLLTGHGGWPMTVFMTPDLKPFYAGTYFPPQDRHGMPSFKRILLGVKTAWETNRAEVEESSSDITKHIGLLDKFKAGIDELNYDLLDRCLEPLIKVFDRQWGGFGGAPKFPHAASISLAMRRLNHRRDGDDKYRDDCAEIMSTTLNRMAWGGMHDQLGGGFARYSVDRRWLIPHFEKMLYDNALIPRNFLDGYLLTGNKYWLEVAAAALDFVLRELTQPEGAFYCSLDADSEGEEGKYYVWTPGEIELCLGREDAAFFCDVFDVSLKGNFEHGKSALNFPDGPEAVMRRYGLDAAAFWAKLNPLKEKLFAEREKRVRPGRDDKMLTSWTALMISCLLDGYRVINEKRYLDAACKAAEFILDRLFKDGRLLRTYGKGIAKLDGYLEDYAYMTQALLDLAACDANPRWLSSALELNEFVLAHFQDGQQGGFFFTSDEHEELISRTKHFFDGSTPSSSSVSVMNLIRIARLTGKQDYLDLAAATMKLYTPYMHKAPDQFSNMLCCLDAYLAQPLEIVLVFDSKENSAEAAKLAEEIYKRYLPNAVIVLCDQANPGFKTLAESVSLLKERKLVDGKAAVYICKNFSCARPITERGELGHLLESMNSRS